MKRVISWRDFSRLLTMVWTNHETKESPFLQGSVCPVTGFWEMDRQSAVQTYSFVDLPALVSGLRNSHAL